MTDTIRMMALSGLAFEDEAPLGWKDVPALPEGAELAKMNAETAQLLHTESSLAEHRRFDPKDENHPLAQDIQRVELKIDVALRLISSLLEHQSALPARRHFRIYAQGLEWIERGSQLAVGRCGIVSLYANRALPFPMELPCEVVATYPTADNNGQAIRAEFRGLSPNVAELIEKLIFRHHRRQVAELRQPRTS